MARDVGPRIQALPSFTNLYDSILYDLEIRGNKDYIVKNMHSYRISLSTTFIASDIKIFKKKQVKPSYNHSWSVPYFLLHLSLAQSLLVCMCVS